MFIQVPEVVPISCIYHLKVVKLKIFNIKSIIFLVKLLIIIIIEVYLTNFHSNILNNNINIALT